MRRRFGRGRKSRGTTGSQKVAIDARCFTQMVEEKIVASEALEPVAPDDIPDHYAAVAVGTSEKGKNLVVAFSPSHGADAAFAGLAYAQQRRAADSDFDGEVIAVCPQWSITARRRLEFLGRTPFGFRAIAASGLAEGENTVEVETAGSASWIPAARVGDRLDAAADRELFARGLAALEGLAAKHGGVVRGSGQRVEFVLLARRVASINTEGGVISLDTFLPEKSNERLEAGQLATVLDRLEGNLRKRLNDKRLRSGEEGVRAELWSALAQVEGVRRPMAWPMSGADAEVVDFAGVASNGDPVVGALRSRLSLELVGEILDAVATLQPVLPGLLSGAEAPLRLGSTRLLLAAREFEAAALALLPLLALDHKTYDIVSRRGRGMELELRGDGAAAATPARRRRRPGATTPKPEEPAAGEDAEVAVAESDEPPRRSSNRRRRGRRGGGRANREPRQESDTSTEVSVEADAGSDSGTAGAPRAERFDSVSLFDLDDDSGDDPGPRRSRRGRGRRRRGKSSAPAGDGGSGIHESSADSRRESAEAEGDDAMPKARRRQGPDRSREAERDSAADEDLDLADDDEIGDDSIPLVADVDVPDVVEDEPPSYDDDAEGPVEEPVEDAQPESDLRRPRRRAAIVAHADRGSLIAAILLARDLRMIEGFWVYPQEELMTFFRGVATDLRDETPIYLVGFTASPARDTIQAASLYAGRIAWFDHHDWPPEDLNSLRETIGAKNLTVTPGNESPVSAVLSERSRRSRFSDKIVELVSGRFSQHDFERWGRVWWERLASIAAQPGDRRADVDALLVGRPSDLAREVAKAPIPPPPLEVAYIASRDFRIVHFGGYRMVVVPVPLEYDLHLSLRVARERYGADLSLGYVLGQEALVLTGDEGRSQRNLDMLSMATHLESKHDWIEKLASDDYVARVRIHDFVLHPDRLDEVVGQIAMGRSILEG